MKAKVSLGPLIERTMRPIDTIPVMLREAQRRRLDWQKIMADSNEQFAEKDQIGSALSGINNFAPILDAPYWNEAIGIGGGWTADEDAIHTVGELIDLLNEDLVGCHFGTQEGDPACLGYWANEGDSDGTGLQFEWEDHHGIGTLLKARHFVEDHLLQGEDGVNFLHEIGAVDFIWMNDPKNTEGRVFKTIEEHYDAIIDPYFGNND